MRRTSGKAAVGLRPENVLGWRLRRQRLQRRAPRGAMLEVVGQLCGLHAQLMSSAELTLWARVEDLEPEAVERALWQERSLVKTWAMRGTLHLLPAAEFPLWLAALSGRRHYLRPSWGRYFGVTPAQLEQMLTAVREALGGRLLTRDELAAEVGRRVGSPELGEKLRSSWGALLKPAAFRGQLCFAPSVGQNVRFTHPDTWLGGGPRRVDPDEARAEVTRRFVSAYGPVTHEHVARWWGVEPAPARALLEAVREELTAVEVEGRSGWMLTADVPEAAETAPEGSVRLLPAFDQYVVGAPRDASILPAALRSRVYRPQGWLSPVLLVDGRMAGVWRHELRGSRVVVQVEPFAPPAADGRAAAEAEAERLAIFLGGTLDLSWASPVR